MTKQFHAVGIRFHLAACLVSVACNALVGHALADHGQVCGTTDVRSDRHFAKLENCKVIEGNLSVVLTNDKTWGDFQGRFPNLIEITGALLLYRVDFLRSLGQLFPNLAVIGGQSLFSGYALVVYELFDLEDIGLHSLTVIRKGAVRLEKNPRLCYIDTVDWSRVTKGVHASENYFKSNMNSTECANVCLDQCDETEGVQRCWNAESCQKMLSCPKDCETGYCNDEVCCHPNCIGGCSGTLDSQCLSCNAVVRTDKNGEEICAENCHSGLYMYLNRRCLTADQCINFTDYSHSRKCHGNDCMRLATVTDEDSNPLSVCSVECPPGYQTNPNYKTMCVPCEGGKCQKVCPGTLIDSLQAAEQLKDCTVINGPLQFKIQNCVDEERMKEYLSGITEVTGYIDVSGSYGLHSLHVLKGLCKFGGQQLLDNKYVLRVFNNPNLQDLFPGESLAELKLSEGSVLFQHNGKLNYNKILEFVSKTGIEQFVDVEDISEETNGDKISPPKPNLQLNLLKVYPRMALIGWQAMSLNDSRHLIGYSVYWKIAPVNSIEVFAEADVCTDIGWKRRDIDCYFRACKDNVVNYMSSLQPWTEYAVYVRALTVTEESAISNVVYFRTAADFPTVPLNMKVEATKPGALHLTWAPPERPNGVITNYKVIWKHIPVRPEQYKIRNYCTYPLRGDENEKPVGTSSQTECCPCSKPSEDIILSFQSILQNNVYIKRIKHETRRQKRRGISNKARTKREETPTNEVNIYNKQEITVTDLGHYEIYYVEVQACHSSSSDNTTICSGSAVVSGRTLPDVLSDVVNNVSVEGMENGFQIKWQDPSQPNGLILSYDIEYGASDKAQPVKVCIPYHEVSGNNYTVDNLEPRKYKFRIRATSLAGIGPWTQYFDHTLVGKNRYTLDRPVYKPGEFPYTKCRQTSGTVTCESLNVSKEIQEKESQWPPGPYAIPMTRYGCPESTSRGWTKGVIMTENDVDIWKLRFCVKSERNKNIDKGIWIPGNYSIYMSGKSCPEGFTNFKRTRNMSKLKSYGHVPNYQRVINLDKSTGYVNFSLCARNSENILTDTESRSTYSILDTIFMFEKARHSDCPTSNGISTEEVTIPDDKENVYCLNTPQEFRETDRGGKEVLSVFDITEERISQSAELDQTEQLTQLVENLSIILQDSDIVLYKLDMIRSLSVSKIEIYNQSDTVKYLNCTYADVQWDSLNHDQLNCYVVKKLKSQTLQLHVRSVEGRFLTLVFEVPKGSHARISATSINIGVFILSLETHNGEICNEDIGMKDGSIQDFQISASSWHSKNVPSAARPRSSGWCAKKSDRHPWILVDLIAPTTVEGVSIWNTEKRRERATDKDKHIWSFSLCYGTKMDDLNIYNDTTFDVHLETPRSREQTFLIPKPFIARYIKLEVWIGFYEERRCLSLEIHGCKLSGVPSLNCHNRSTPEMFPITSEIKTAETRIDYNESSSIGYCKDLCLRNDNCSVTSHVNDHSCVQYMPNPSGIWQVNDSVNGSWSAKLCATDSVQLFPSFHAYDGTIMSNIQLVESTTIITTIGYPFTYGSGQEYKWMINFPEQHYILIIFTDVSLGSESKSQERDTPSSCDRLFISKELKRESHGKTVDHLFNGRVFVVETGESKLFLSFTSCISDKAITSRGFRAIVSKKEVPACLSIDSKKPWTKERKETCDKPKMVLTSMSILNIPFENEERWNIYAGMHNSIRMEVMDFYVLCKDVSDTISSFEIVDIPDTTAYCNTRRPPKSFHLKNSNVTIIFRKFDAPNLKIARREGFRLQYNIISHSLANLTDYTETAVEFGSSAFEAVEKVCSAVFKKCYYVISSMVSWSQAGSECWQNNTRLVSIHSKEEHNYIHYLLRDLRFRELGRKTKTATKGLELSLEAETASEGSTFEAHIGLYGLRDEQGRKKYVWQNNSPMTFSAWSSGNPSDGDCTHTNFRHFNEDNTWVSEDCNERKAQYFICEMHIGDKKGESRKDKTCGIADLVNYPQINVTYSGKICQHWNALTDNALHSFKDRVSDNLLPMTASNLCQDPLSLGMLWCFTTDPNSLIEPCFLQGEVQANKEFERNTSTDTFECDNGTFIPNTCRCDGIFDCLDLTDEVFCQEIVKHHLLVGNENRSSNQMLPANLEPGSYYMCGSKEWISVVAKCDGIIDCLDASDEVNCARLQGECNENEFSCGDSSCIHASQVCDFIPDCANSKDEFCEFRPCALEEYMCDNKQCISRTKRCNGIPDCIDKSDESLCASCKEGAFHCDVYKCIKEELRCDKFPDCNDKSDENSCRIDTLTSCAEWWEQGYHTSGQYRIDGMAVNCDFSSVETSGGKIKMHIRNVDVDLNSGSLYTRAVFDSKISLNEYPSKFRNCVYRKDYECLLEVKSSCHFPESETLAFDDPNSFVLKHCHCAVGYFKFEIQKNRRQDLPFGYYGFRDYQQFLRTVTEYNLKAHKFHRCSGIRQPVDTSLNYYSVNDLSSFHVDTEVLHDEIPVEITVGPITCSYGYQRNKHDMKKCDGNENMIPESMLCVYDVDVVGYTIGCRDGSHLKNCDDFTCPENTVKCPGSYCIPLRFVCDGSVHCPRGEDENNCSCTDSGREIVILTEDTSYQSVSETTATMLARQFYTPGSTIRTLHYKARRIEKIPLENDLLEIREEYIYPYEALDRTPECRYKTTARNLLHSIKFSSKGSNGLLFFEDSEKSSRVAEIMFSNTSKPIFTIYRVMLNTDSLHRKVNRYVHVKDVQINKWSSLSSIGYKRFPDICKAGLNVPCSGAYRCLSSKQCIPLKQVCDGIVQCRNADDERLCDFRCPEKCNCDGLVVGCRSVDFNESDIKVLPVNTRSVDISQNPGVQNVLRQSNLRFPFLLRMNLSFCEIKLVNKSAFINVNNLRSLDLGYNQIVELPDKIFSNLYHLTHLNLDGNFELTKILPAAFHGLRSIRNLRISGTKLKRISAFTFSGLTLESIDISNNTIEEIEDYAFSNISVGNIDFTDNSIVKFNKLVFKDVTSLQELHTPAFKFCCVRPCYVSENKCFPTKNEFSSCDDLMRHPVLQAILWIVGIASLFGNFGSIMYRLMYDRERLKIGYGIFVTNLAAADFLMGVYLIMIATVDSLYRKRYIFFDHQWRNSNWCVTAGILSTVSSEASVLFLCLITLDRLLVIKYPFGTIRFGPSKAYLCCCISWVISITLALIPVFFTNYFQNQFYSRSGVCIALPLTRDKPPGWMYSVSIFVGLNFCTFILVAVGQLSIFLELRKATKGIQKSQSSRRRDLRVARNLILVATTDFLCWFPIGVMGIMAMNGHPIPGDVYAWTAVFILPLNSALNPVLYTLSAIIGKQSFNPSIEEQSRVEIQKERGSSVLQYKSISRFVKTKDDGARVIKSRRLQYVLEDEGALSVGSVAQITSFLAKYLCILHESSLSVERLTEKNTYLRVDESKRKMLNIILDTKTSLLKDKLKTQENIYQFGQLLNKMVSKCDKKQ